MEPILLAGIGNVLTGDDAVGPTAVKLLEAWWELGPEVAVVEAGTPGMDLVLALEMKRCAIIVDAVRAPGTPGEIRCFDKAALLRQTSGLTLSPHEPGLQDALRRLEFFGTGPLEVAFIGVIPGTLETGVGLSAKVLAALPRVAERVLLELSKRGVTARPRRRPLAPDLWWQQQPVP